MNTPLQSQTESFWFSMAFEIFYLLVVVQYTCHIFVVNCTYVGSPIYGHFQGLSKQFQQFTSIKQQGLGNSLAGVN